MKSIKIVLQALLDDEREVYINCGENLDWFVKSAPEADVCVTFLSENGDEHQSLVEKRRLCDIRLREED